MFFAELSCHFMLWSVI